MKTELDYLMKQNDIDALLITGAGQHNPAMVYLTGIAHLTGADLIKKRGEAPTLFYPVMEREEAQKAGLRTKNYQDYDWKNILQQAENDIVKAKALRYKYMLEDCGISRGTIALYGHVELGQAFSVFNYLQQLLPEAHFVGLEYKNDILALAMFSKEDAEIERIRKMGAVTVEVVSRVANMISNCQSRDEVLFTEKDRPLTIAEVKSKINLWLAELGAENPEDTIFSIGRDAAIPHSSGNPTDVIRLGQSIVFDIFPCEAGGGYFHDFTRTWSVGYATDELQRLYNDVLTVYRQIVSDLKVGEPFKKYHQQACEMFDRMGHPTICKDNLTQDGYNHSLGHGVGLRIHERPFSGSSADELDILKPGSVFTIEPGLYYPDKGMGVRLENTFVVTSDGNIKLAAEYPLDLVLPVS